MTLSQSNGRDWRKEIAIAQVVDRKETFRWAFRKAEENAMKAVVKGSTRTAAADALEISLSTFSRRYNETLPTIEIDEGVDSREVSTLLDDAHGYLKMSEQEDVVMRRTVVRALRVGASVEEVAQALGLSVDDLNETYSLSNDWNEPEEKACRTMLGI